MPRKTLICLLVIALLATGLLTACGTTTVTQTNTTTNTVTSTHTTTTTGPIETVPTTTTEQVTRPASWDQFGEPKYGGTYTYRAYPGMDQVFYDPYLQSGFGGFAAFALAYDNVFHVNWYVDRTVSKLKTNEDNNLPMFVGNLFDSWEVLDPVTIKCHVREGIHFWDRPPANGRELVAGDIVAHFDRMLGLDGGEPNASFAMVINQVESITAQGDDYVTYKLYRPTLLAYAQVFCAQGSAVSEVEYPLGRNVTKHEDMIGTGPYWIKEEVPGSSITYEKNPDYWAFDERFPENRLPYLDEVKVVAITDMTTAITALRTGKIDMLGMIDWRQAANLEQTNPEFKQTYSVNMGYGLRLRVDQPPFDDINLRKALQMAIDRPLLAETHYGGTVSPDPAGIGTPNTEGWFTPFNEWPQSLRDEYTYSPEKAKALLQAAGYTPSSPLKFETSAETTSDLDQLQIIQAMLKEVGFDMTIKTVTPGTVFPIVGMKQYETLYFNTTGLTLPKGVSIYWFSPTRSTLKATQNQATAAELEAMIDKYLESANFEEARLNFLAVEQYCLAQHWDILTVSPRTYTVWNPDLLGYDGETSDIQLSNWVPKVWKK